MLPKHENLRSLQQNTESRKDIDQNFVDQIVTQNPRGSYVPFSFNLARACLSCLHGSQVPHAAGP